MTFLWEFGHKPKYLSNFDLMMALDSINPDRELNICTKSQPQSHSGDRGKHSGSLK